jgi:hypothetical protein
MVDTYCEGVGSMGKVLSVGTKVKIVDVMSADWIGKEAVVTKVISVNPICYLLDIGGGHWLNSCVKKN